MNKILDQSDVPSLEKFEEDMGRPPTWTEKQLKKCLEWISSKDEETQLFIGYLILPAVLGYAMMGHNFEKFGIIDLLTLPFAYMAGGMLQLAFMIVKLTSKEVSKKE